MAGRLLGPLGLLALSLVGLALTWQIVSAGMSVHLREGNPQAAVDWRQDDARAWSLNAEVALAAGRQDVAADAARRAIAVSALQARAFRTLGQVMAREGDAAAAARLFTFTSYLSRREPAVSFWLYRDALMAGRYAAALVHADALMRRAPRTISIIVPDLVAVVGDPRATAAIVERLSHEPRWRRYFMRVLPQEAPAALALEVYRALAETEAPATSGELARLLTRMAGDGAFEDAYAAWLSFVPPEARPQGRGVYDPTFTRPAGPEPFGWRFSERGGAEATPAPAGGSGLSVRQNGFETALAARQYLMLPAGAYRLTSRARVEDGPEAGLEWRLNCRGGRPVAKTPFEFAAGGEGRAAQDFVLQAPCPMQELSLYAVGGDSRAPTVTVIEGVEIQPMGALQ